MRSIVALTVFAFAGLSLGQSEQQQNYPYTIDPESVSKSDRQAWCDNQKAQCPLICLQQPGVESMTTIANDCDPDALTYSCICENNVAPNITQFSLTLPYYICTAWGTQCVKNCGNDNTCQDKCRSDHICGAQHPNPPNSSILTMTSMTIAPTGSATLTGSSSLPPTAGFAGQTASPGGGQGAASATLNLGQSYGLAIVFAGVFAGFALIL